MHSNILFLLHSSIVSTNTLSCGNYHHHQEAEHFHHLNSSFVPFCRWLLPHSQALATRRRLSRLHGTLPRLENDDSLLNIGHLRSVHHCTCMRTLFTFDCCVLFHPTSPYVSINSKVSSLLGASAQTLLVSVSSYQFSMLLKCPLADFQGAWLEHQMGWPLRAYKQKAYKGQSSDSYQSLHHWNHLGVQNIPDAWSVPRAPAVIAECGLGLRGSQNFPDDSTMQPGDEPEIKGVMVASWKVF